MIYEDVYRTTPATPGLLKMSEYRVTTGHGGHGGHGEDCTLYRRAAFLLGWKLSLSQICKVENCPSFTPLPDCQKEP